MPLKLRPEEIVTIQVLRNKGVSNVQISIHHWPTIVAFLLFALVPTLSRWLRNLYSVLGRHMYGAPSDAVDKAAWKRLGVRSATRGSIEKGVHRRCRK
jgi:hypothetical protein